MGWTEGETGEEGTKLESLGMRSRKTPLAREHFRAVGRAPPRSWKALGCGAGERRGLCSPGKLMVAGTFPTERRYGMTEEQ